MIAQLANGFEAPNGTPMFIEQHVPCGTKNMYARVYEGSGPAFAMIYGFLNNIHAYDDLVPLLVAAGRRVITFNLLGFAQSDKPLDACYSFKQQLDGVKVVEDRLDLQSLIPVAHDLPSATAVDFAIEYLDRIA